VCHKKLNCAPNLYVSFFGEISSQFSNDFGRNGDSHDRHLVFVEHEVRVHARLEAELVAAVLAAAPVLGVDVAPAADVAREPGVTRFLDQAEKAGYVFFNCCIFCLGLKCHQTKC
jgi:hypothetical protein